jgi:hypothetical protein
VFTDSINLNGPITAHQSLFASAHAPGPVKSGANNKYGKNQCQGKGKGIYRRKPAGIFQKKQQENKDAPQKNAARVGGRRSGREPFIRSNCRPGGN